MTACVKCFVLWVNNQSGLLAMAERRTGTSAACLIRWRLDCTLDADELIDQYRRLVKLTGPEIIPYPAAALI